MSRTHIQSSYGLRSLGIAGFVVAVSFFANTVPALAQQYDGASSASGGSSSHSSSYQGYGGDGGSNSGPGFSGQDSYGGTQTRPSPDQQLKQLQERIKQLDDMKAKLEKLLASLQQHASTTPDKPKCFMPFGLLFGGASTSTSTSHEGCRPLVQLPHPILCPQGSHAGSGWGGVASTTAPCHPLPALLCGGPTGCHSASTTCADCGGLWRPPFHDSTTTNPVLFRCYDCNSAGGGGFAPSNNGAATPMRNQSSNSSFGGYSGQGFGGIDITSHVGGSSFGGNSYSGGAVRGASSDMSAEMAETLDGLRGDLLNLSDMLNQ